VNTLIGLALIAGFLAACVGTVALLQRDRRVDAERQARIDPNIWWTPRVIERENNGHW
jgi:hypothetical protein